MADGTTRETADDAVERAESRLLRVTFGDRSGAALFLAALVFFGLYWRVRPFSNDHFAVLNALVAVADGHLHLERLVYGPASGVTPGTSVVDGRLYGRNYGHVVASLPALLALQGLGVVFDLRALVVGAWSLGVFGLTAFAGRVAHREREAALVGGGLAVLLFVANVLVASPLDARWLPLVAMQATTMVAAALVPVVLYRLVAAVRDRRLGLATGAAAFLGTPVGFWASIPKRHGVMALAAVLVLYTFYRSRAVPVERERRLRALAYAWVGLAAWVHSAEAFVLLVALAAVDLPTARTSGPRDLAVVGGAFLVSLLPFLLTNALVSGNPLRPPRLIEAYTGGGASGDGATAASPAPSGTDGPASAAGLVLPVAAHVVGRLVGELADGIAVLGRPGHLWRVFVRSGYTPGLPRGQDVAVNLSVLESMPLLGVLAAAPVLAVRRVRAGWRPERSPARLADAFALAHVALLVVVVLPRLPLHHMLTVRYLHSAYPLGLYLVARTPPVRRVVDAGPRWLAGAYAGTVAASLPAALLVLRVGDLVLGEAVQAFALVLAVVGGAVAVWAVAATIRADRVDARVGAVVLGVAAGLVTTYLLVSGSVVFALEREFALPAVRLVADWVDFATTGV